MILDTLIRIKIAGVHIFEVVTLVVCLMAIIVPLAWSRSDSVLNEIEDVVLVGLICVAQYVRIVRLLRAAREKQVAHRFECRPRKSARSSWTTKPWSDKTPS